MVRMFLNRFISFLALILMIALVASAQAPATGRLTGAVTDAQGGLVPGAVIQARNDQTGSEIRAVSNAVGFWVMPSVPSGSYTVSVDAQGFRTSAFKDIIIEAQSSVTVDATIQVGFPYEATVTASKYEQEVIDAPATVSVISEQTIRAAPTQNVPDLLRGVPGVNVAQTSARGFGITGRSATGVMPSTQLLLIDGRTAYCDYLGGAYWDNVPTSLDDIKQMEVIRGPASAVWGAYALNGVVNIVTKPPREILGTTLTLGVGTFDRSGSAADSNRGSLYYMRATHAQALNDRWAFKVTGGIYTQDAFTRPQGAIPNPYQTPYPAFPNEGATQPKLNARVDYDLPDGKQHFTFEGGYASGNGITYSGFGPTKAEGNDKAGYGKVDYARGALRITGFVNTWDAKDSWFLFVDPAGETLQWKANAQIYNVDISNYHTIWAKHLISYGGNFRHMEVSARLMPEVRRHNEGGAYFQDEIMLSNHFRWVVGARVDKFDNLTGAVFSPRTTFMVKPAIGQTVRVSYNRAYVAPWTILNYFLGTGMSWIDLGLIDPQLAGNYFGFPLRVEGSRDLKAQSLNAYEVGYTAMVARDRVNLGAAFYINDSKNDFYWSQTGSYTAQNPPAGWPLPPFVLDAMIAANAMGPGMGLPSLINTQNAGKVRNKGLELNAEARLNRYLTVYSNYSWQAKPEAKEIGLYSINLPPTHRFNAGLDFDYKRYLGNVSVGYVGSAYWNDVISTIYSGPTKAYTAVNAGAGVRWGKDWKYMIMLKVSNLANARIQNHVFGDILKRQISGELKMRFGK